MARRAKVQSASSSNAANLGFETTMWAAADKLRNNMDAAEYKHIVLANGSMSSNQSGEGEIRKNIIEADLADCMIAMPVRSAAAAFSRLLVEPSQWEDAEIHGSPE